MARFLRNHRHMLRKTASYYVMHISVAALVAYAVTGNLLMALTLSLLEPTVQAVAFFFHEKAWARADRRAALGSAPSAPAVPAATPTPAPLAA